MIDLIYCAGANPRLTAIAQEAGYLLGIRSDRADYGFPISFVDIDYKHADWGSHLRTIRKHVPKYATVPDLPAKPVEKCWQEILHACGCARILSNYCEIPLIVPKVSGQITEIPEDIAIGYSVPTSYGGAQYPLWELAGRRIHLLGGSPHMQMLIYRYLQAIGSVVSADGNMAQKMAIQHAKFWLKGKWIKHPEHSQNKRDLYLDCWRRSCINIRQRWFLISSPAQPVHI